MMFSTPFAAIVTLAGPGCAGYFQRVDLSRIGRVGDVERKRRRPRGGHDDDLLDAIERNGRAAGGIPDQKRIVAIAADDRRACRLAQSASNVSPNAVPVVVMPNGPGRTWILVLPDRRGAEIIAV